MKTTQHSFQITRLRRAQRRTANGGLNHLFILSVIEGRFSEPAVFAMMLFYSSTGRGNTVKLGAGEFELQTFYLRDSKMKIWIASIVCMAAGLVCADGAVVLESARDIPVAYDVDVVVVGGSTGAVAAAAAAAKSGAKVFLAAPRHYLGDV